MASSAATNPLKDNSASKCRQVRFRIAIAAASVMFAAYYLILQLFLHKHFLDDPDTSLHIGVGNWILNNLQFPVTDKFSHTAFGQVWRATDWISEVSLALLYRFGGWSAVAAAVSVTVAALAGMLSYYLAKKVRFSVALGLTAIMILMISPHFLARPVIFAYPLLLIWIALILEIEDREQWGEPRAFLLIPIMVLWANVHAGFTLGLMILYLFVGNAAYGAFIAKNREKLKRLLMLTVGITIAASITPFGIFSALKTVNLLNIPELSHINEWAPPNFANNKIHLAFIMVFFALLIYYGIRVRGPRLLSLLVVFMLALEHRRGLGLFSFLAPLLVLRPLLTSLPWLATSSTAADPVVQFVGRRSSAIVITCGLVLAIGAPAMWLIQPPVRPPNPMAPIAAVNAAERAHLSGNVLNSYAFGGYLALKGIPTFVDGRVGLFGNRFLERYFDLLKQTNPGKADQILRQYNVRWALLKPNQAIAVTLMAQGWKQIYKDHDATVLAKQD